MTTVQIRLLAINEQEIETARAMLAEAHGSRFRLQPSKVGLYGDVMAYGELNIPEPPGPRLITLTADDVRGSDTYAGQPLPDRDKPRRNKRRR